MIGDTRITGAGQETWVAGTGTGAAAGPPNTANTSLSQVITQAVSDYLGGPDGQLPTLPGPSHGGLSLESLVKALGDEERKLAVKTGLTTLDDKKKAQAELYDKQLREIQDRLDKMAEKKTVNTFLKVFKCIGAIVGAVAGVAAIAIGVVTANPLMIVGGALLTVTAASSLTSAITDGKHGISAWVSQGCQKLGLSEDVAKWVGFGVELALQITGCVLTLGAGLAAAKAAKAAELAAAAATTTAEATAATTVATAAATTATAAATTATAAGTTVTTTTMVKTAASIVSQVGGLLSGLNSIGTGALTIYGGHLDKETSYSLATSKELSAILEKLRASMEIEQDLLEAVIKKYQSMTDKAMDIINENNQAQTTILSGEAFSSPAMA